MPNIKISHGELLDKFTILEIKLVFINNPKARENINNEIAALKDAVNLCFEIEDVRSIFEQLLKVNTSIFIGMDKIFEIGENDSPEYLVTVREVTSLNKERSYLKKKIDEICKSEFSEEKSYF